MAIQTVDYFKGKFVTGYVLTAADIADWLDSFRSMLVSVPLGDTTGLDDTLSAYRKVADKIATTDIDGLADFVNALLTNVLTTASSISQSQISGLPDALASFATNESVQSLVNSALHTVTPSVGENGNWWVNGADTGVKATGADGAAPSIGTNSNWFVGTTDTGVRANYTRQIDYNADIAGTRNGVAGNVFTASRAFVPTSLSVYFDGARLTAGNGADYVINSDNTGIILARAVTDKNMLIFDYLPTNYGAE